MPVPTQTITQSELGTMSDGSENELINLDEDNMEDDDDYERQRQENMR